MSWRGSAGPVFIVIGRNGNQPQWSTELRGEPSSGWPWRTGYYEAIARIAVLLRREGIVAGAEEACGRLMREDNLLAIRRRKFSW